MIQNHAAWLLILGPIVGLLLRSLPPARVRFVAISAVILGTGGLVGVGLWQYFTWWNAASAWAREYAVQRYFFSLACLVDFPTVQLLIAGAVLQVGAMLKSRRVVSGAVDQSAEQPCSPDPATAAGVSV